MVLEQQGELPREENPAFRLSDMGARIHELGLRVVHLLQQQDQEAAADTFGIIVTLAGERVEQVVRKHSNRPDELTDLVQDTFHNAWRGIGSFRGEGPLIAWLCKTAKQRVKDVQQKAGNRVMNQAYRVGEVDWFESIMSSTNADPGRIVPERLRLLEILKSLPERSKKVFLMHVELDLEPDEIAEELGIKPNAVSALLYRTRRTIREEYEIDQLLEKGYLDPRIRPAPSQQRRGIKPLQGKARARALRQARAARKAEQHAEA